MNDLLASINDLLAFLVVVLAAPLAWFVVMSLWALLRKDPTNPVLRSNTYSALALATIVTVFAVVFANNGLDVPVLGPLITMFLTRSTLLVAVVVGSVYWLRYRYRRK